MDQAVSLAYQPALPVSRPGRDLEARHTRLRLLSLKGAKCSEQIIELINQVRARGLDQGLTIVAQVKWPVGENWDWMMMLRHQDNINTIPIG